VCRLSLQDVLFVASVIIRVCIRTYMYTNIFAIMYINIMLFSSGLMFISQKVLFCLF
jgi:hypothetical protein